MLRVEDACDQEGLHLYSLVSLCCMFLREKMEGVEALEGVVVVVGVDFMLKGRNVLSRVNSFQVASVVNIFTTSQTADTTFPRQSLRHMLTASLP